MALTGTLINKLKSKPEESELKVRLHRPITEESIFPTLIRHESGSIFLAGAREDYNFTIICLADNNGDYSFGETIKVDIWWLIDNATEVPTGFYIDITVNN